MGGMNYLRGIAERISDDNFYREIDHELDIYADEPPPPTCKEKCRAWGLETAKLAAIAFPVFELGYGALYPLRKVISLWGRFQSGVSGVFNNPASAAVGNAMRTAYFGVLGAILPKEPPHVWNVVTAPIIEELVTRGLIQELILRRLPRAIIKWTKPGSETVVDHKVLRISRVIFSTYLFVIMHQQHPPTAILDLFAGGIMFGTLQEICGHPTPGIIVHIAHNALEEINFQASEVNFQ